MKLYLKFISLTASILLITGCAHVISEQVLSSVDRSITGQSIFANPDAFIGKMVILGGTIIKTTNTSHGSIIEVVQKPLDYDGRPLDTDVSYGRFLIQSEQFLDSEIYSKGKDITAAGVIAEKKEKKLDEIMYTYPVIIPKELHIFKPYPMLIYGYPTSGIFYDPYHIYRPYPFTGYPYIYPYWSPFLPPY